MPVSILGTPPAFRRDGRLRSDWLVRGSVGGPRDFLRGRLRGFAFLDYPAPVRRRR